MRDRGSLAAVILGLSGGAFIALVATAVARRGFLGRIERLQWSLEQTRTGSEKRTDLPPEVLALARRLGVSDDGRGRIVDLTQSGEMWLRPGSKPVSFAARQTLAVAEVAFLWHARLPMGPGLSMKVIDYVVGDEAGLEGRLLGVLPVVRMTNADTMFRGEAMRYLAELIWNPDAMLLNRHLDWRVLDVRTLAVATGEGARRCEIRMILDATGDLMRMEADDRPRQSGRVTTNSPWFGRASDYRTIGGRRIPVQAEVGWLLDGVEFVYWRGRVESWLLKS